MTKTEKQERRLVRRAAAALVALSEFREKHGAVGDVETTLRINGFSKADAKQIASRMLNAGITPWGARQLFAEAGRMRQ
jgi:hypothetical protein